jgi:hypothetical protein
MSSTQVLRHMLATLAYRAAKVLRATPDGFATTTAGGSGRSSLQIVAHMADLMAWGVTIAKGDYVWTAAGSDDWATEVDAWANEAIWSRLEDPEQRLLAAASALEAQPWSDRQALVCASIGTPVEALRPLFQRGLLYSDSQTAAAPPEHATGGHGAAMLLYGALRNAAAARLREDDQLRERVAELAADLDSAPVSAPLAPPVLADASVEPSVPVPVSSGMELLERVRNALEDSAVFLQEQGNDQASQQLA